jgi:DNA-binding NarL/FixJ family response regulator
LRKVAEFSDGFSRNCLSAREQRLIARSFSDPDNLNKLDNLVESVDYRQSMQFMARNLFSNKVMVLLSRGLTQEEVAKQLSVSQSTVSRTRKHSITRLYYIINRKYGKLRKRKKYKTYKKAEPEDG